MENYKRYKENNPHKTDAQIIESLVWELKDKVETIHRLLAENEALRIHDVVGRSEQLVCDCQDFENGMVSMYCNVHNENPYTPD